MPFPGKTRFDFAASTSKGCGSLRLESPGGGSNRDAKRIMPHTTVVVLRKAEGQLRRIPQPGVKIALATDPFSWVRGDPGKGHGPLLKKSLSDWPIDRIASKRSENTAKALQNYVAECSINAPRGAWRSFLTG